jgi:hypothetical protein
MPADYFIRPVPSKTKTPVPWYVVSFDKKSIKPFQLFVVGKVGTLFSQNRRQLEWLQDATFAKPVQAV